MTVEYRLRHKETKEYARIDIDLFSSPNSYDIQQVRRLGHFGKYIYTTDDIIDALRLLSAPGDPQNSYIWEDESFGDNYELVKLNIDPIPEQVTPFTFIGDPHSAPFMTSVLTDQEEERLDLDYTLLDNVDYPDHVTTRKEKVRTKIPVEQLWSHVGTIVILNAYDPAPTFIYAVYTYEQALEKGLVGKSETSYNVLIGSGVY